MAELVSEGPSEDQTMIINMGPQHPSTHGVLRLMLELEGETVLRTKPIVGYLHTGMEKTGEDLTYLQGPTNVTRMDYAAPLFNELVFSLTTEKLLGIDEDIPERAQWIRMLLTEINRITSNLLFLATNGMDIGAVSMMIYGWRDREEGLRLLEMITGLRMNHNYIRPGGVAADLPDGWRDAVLTFIDSLPASLDEYDVLLTGQPIYRERLQGVGVITAQEAIALGATGPILRSTGVPWDLRRDMPYLHYEQVEFDVVVGTYGDCFDRYAIRLNEIRESIRIIRQVLDAMPHGRLPHPGQEGHAAAARPHRRVDGGADPPLQDLHRGLQGARGRGLHGHRVAARRARLLHRERRLREAVPHAHPRPELREPPDAPAHDARRPHRRRRRRHLVRRPDHGRGRPLMAALSAENTITAKEIIARYPRPKSALIPLLHLAQEQDGYVAEDAMAHIAELIGVTPAEVLGTCSFYEMFKREPVGEYLVNVCTNISCMLLGGEELLHHLEDRLGIKSGSTTPDGTFTIEDVECIAACTEAPCLQVNYRYFYKVTPDDADALIDDLRHGRRAHEVPKHGVLARTRQQLPHDRRAGNAVPGECRGARVAPHRRAARGAGVTVTDAKPIVTTRFDLDDGHTLDRYLATGGYEGLKAALAKAPDRGRRRGEGGQPARPGRRRLPGRHQVGVLPARACGRATSW